MKLSVNKDYFRRHLFVTLLMAGLGLWFGYDGFIRYPSMSAGDLYRSIEKSDPPASVNLEAFKKQKTQTQYGFTVLSLLAALVIGLRLKKACAFQFEFDDAGFVWKNHRFAYADIQQVDRSKWESKSILILKMKAGVKITLDAWHHVGVKDFAASARLTERFNVQTLKKLNE